ncbi:MAG: hypothetical protein GEU78_14085 [Actinobacteria bacterium]|nr:hypothetical protein [Actinomycetota bacterium]
MFFLAALALWVYCIFDVVSTDESLTRNLPKIVWLMLVIFVPTVGSIAWLVLGRPVDAGFTPGDPRPRIAPPRRSQRALGPDDDPRFLADLGERRRRLEGWEEDLKRREEELKRREDGDAV